MQKVNLTYWHEKKPHAYVGLGCLNILPKIAISSRST